MNRADLAVRGRTAKGSVAAIYRLRDPQGASFAAQVDGDNAGPAILERIPSIRIAVADLVEGIADPASVTDPRILTSLEAQGIRLVDLPLPLDAGGKRDGWAGSSDEEQEGQWRPK